jgi:ParB-like nuclease domain
MFTHLSVHRGSEVVRFPLGGAAAKRQPPDGAESTCPCGIPVVYDEMNGWQHADGSISHDDGESVSEKMDSVAKDAADLSDPNPVEAEHVKNQMRANYPEKAIGWISAATWIGPVQVPQGRVNFAGRDGWAASHEPGAVKRFTRHIKAGTGHTHPVVMVQEPGESKADVVDGHHRTLAYEKLGRPVTAYIGFTPQGDHRWRETHSSQVHQGADRANKAGGAGPKG